LAFVASLGFYSERPGVSGDGEAAQTGLMHAAVIARFVFRVCDKRHTILPPGPEGGALAGDGRHGSMIPDPGRVRSRNDIVRF
jgi:hypothetical protein